MEIRKATNTTGAEVLGVDVATGLDAETAEAIRTALDEHGVIVLQDQNVTPEQQVAFTHLFGEPDINFNALRFGIDGSPEIYIISNINKDGKPIGTRRAGENLAYGYELRAEPAAATMLYAVEVPTLHGLPLGDTAFANAAAAWDALPTELKEAVTGLRGFSTSVAVSVTRQ